MPEALGIGTALLLAAEALMATLVLAALALGLGATALGVPEESDVVGLLAAALCSGVTLLATGANGEAAAEGDPGRAAELATAVVPTPGIAAFSLLLEQAVSSRTLLAKPKQPRENVKY